MFTIQHERNNRYVLFSDFHVAPLSGLRPEDLKAASELARKQFNDREPLKHNTALNHLARRLGFMGGFSGYKKYYAEKIQPFMEQHGLIERTDLVRPRFHTPCIRIKPRQLADRLFQMDRPMPVRVFTGFDLDWGTINMRFFQATLCQEDPIGKARLLVDDGLGASSWHLEHPVNAAIEFIRIHLPAFDHTLGGPILDCGQEIDPPIRQIFYSKTHTEETKCREDILYQKVQDIFAKWLEMVDCGWVDVIPFNSNLIFLRAPGGKYDLLISGARDSAFDHNLYAPYLKNADAPKSNDQYHFERWLYFHYKGWLEHDRNLAETKFYSDGGVARDYPGENVILRSLLIESGAYRVPNKKAPEARGYFKVNLNGNDMYVSDLVTIGDFKAFMQSEAREYFGYRRNLENVDNLLTVNDDSGDLPASVTWYDACAYAAWISKKRGLPVRLLEYPEYSELYKQAKQPIPHPGYNQQLCQLHEFGMWFDPEGKQLCDHPPYMEEKKFQRHVFRFAAGALEWAKHSSGLQFARNSRFGEWLNAQGAAVNTLYLGSVWYATMEPRAHTFSPRSTGKYKSLKIGFRLCYLAE